jgi:hypothetical protein
MAVKTIELPSSLNKENWFYEANKVLLDPHLGKPYISYSSVSSWVDYREDFIKQKLAGIKLPDGVYGKLGNYAGEALENGKFAEENPYGFTGQENLDFKALRPAGAEYEKMILIDMESYVIIGFIDRYHETSPGVAHIRDLKTGGKGKEKDYADPKYIQVMLYAHAIEQTGVKIGKTDVYFVRRTGSHIKPPLHISTEQFVIDLEYTKERVDFALAKVDKAVNEISDIFKVYKKFFA